MAIVAACLGVEVADAYEKPSSTAAGASGMLLDCPPLLGCMETMIEVAGNHQVQEGPRGCCLKIGGGSELQRGSHESR